MGKGENRTIVLEIVDDKESIDLDELNEHIMLMEAVRSHLDVEWTESVGAVDARHGHEVFGFTSTLAYLKYHFMYRAVSPPPSSRGRSTGIEAPV